MNLGIRPGMVGHRGSSYDDCLMLIGRFPGGRPRAYIIGEIPEISTAEIESASKNAGF